MAIAVVPEQTVVNEAVELLLKHMDPARVARLLSAWQVGKGDYLTLRDELFARESVDTLFEKVLEFEKMRGVDAAPGEGKQPLRQMQ
jgi:hypothetical protein